MPEKCWQGPTLSWCPAGSLAERRRANGAPVSVALAREHAKDHQNMSIAACRAHNQEIALAQARGYAGPPQAPGSKSRALKAERVAHERMSRRDPPSWNKFEQRTQWSVRIGQSPAGVIVPTVLVKPLLQYGPTDQVAEFVRREDYDDFCDAYEQYAAVVSLDPCWARLIKRGENDWHVTYGFTTRHEQHPAWREVTIPKNLRASPRKKR